MASSSKKTNYDEVQAAKYNLLNTLWQTSVAPKIASKFSSQPITLFDAGGGPSFDNSKSFISSSEDNNNNVDNNVQQQENNDEIRSKIISASTLTDDEKKFLEELIESDDLPSLKTASKRLSDRTVFPYYADEEEEQQDNNNDNEKEEDDSPPPTTTTSTTTTTTTTTNPRTLLYKRGGSSSELQLQLFRLHEQNSTLNPSELLRRISMTEKKSSYDNSITREDDRGDGDGSSWDYDNEIFSSDLNAWIDGSQGVEINDDDNDNDNDDGKKPTTTTTGGGGGLSSSTHTFKILGTSADDVTCHPHILSPPLMESLLAFVPESLQFGYNFWLKYSLARDSPSLLTMLRHCRASSYTILAIETTDGNIFGSFTSQPWRLLSPEEFYGSKDSFVWRMRQSRNQPYSSIMEQVLAESKIDVFPYTGNNTKIQFCSKDFLALGEEELEDYIMDDVKDGTTHFGNAIRLNSSMTIGSTSTSMTYANPSLIHNDKRGEEFTVANIEMWALTPHTSLEIAVRSEMNNLFLEEERKTKNLNILEILVS